MKEAKREQANICQYWPGRPFCLEVFFFLVMFFDIWLVDGRLGFGGLVVCVHGAVFFDSLLLISL